MADQLRGGSTAGGYPIVTKKEVPTLFRVVNSNLEYSEDNGSTWKVVRDGGNADTSKHLIGDDTRSVNSNPSVYMEGGSRYAGQVTCQAELKSTSTIGAGSFIASGFCYLETKTPWNDSSGGYPIQMAYGGGTPCWRIGISTTAWSAWQALNSGGNANTVDNKHVWVGAEASKGTNANTIYFCY